jgi:hypothetical protein
MGIGEARARGNAMSAGHSMRRQNYSFPAITPPTPHTTSELHYRRVVLAVVIALVLNFASVASISMLITG